LVAPQGVYRQLIYETGVRPNPSGNVLSCFDLCSAAKLEMMIFPSVSGACVAALQFAFHEYFKDDGNKASRVGGPEGDRATG
jgi:hypothetical protein